MFSPRLVGFSTISIVLFSFGCGERNFSHISEDQSNSSQTRRSRTSANSVVHSPLGWSKSVSVMVATNAPDIIADAIERAVQSWNDAAGAELMKFEGRGDGLPQSDWLYSTLDDEVTVVYFCETWEESTRPGDGKPGKPATTLATTVWENDPSERRSIYRGDVILNAGYHFVDSSIEVVDEDLLTNDDVVDAETVVLHELGHLLGLDHPNDDADSVMKKQTNLGWGRYNRIPTDLDARNIKSIYGESARH